MERLLSYLPRISVTELKYLRKRINRFNKDATDYPISATLTVFNVQHHDPKTVMFDVTVTREEIDPSRLIEKSYRKVTLEWLNSDWYYNRKL